MGLRWRRDEEPPGPDGEPRGRRRPAFFLQALLTEDIPPYLTDEAGEKLQLSEDPLATRYQDLLETDPASL